MKWLLFVALLSVMMASSGVFARSMDHDKEDLDRMQDLDAEGKHTAIVDPNGETQEEDDENKGAGVDTVGAKDMDDLLKGHRHHKKIHKSHYFSDLMHKLSRFWKKFSVRVNKIAARKNVDRKKLWKKIDRKIKYIAKSIEAKGEAWNKKLNAKRVKNGKKPVNYNWRPQMKKFWDKLLTKHIPKRRILKKAKGEDIEDKSVYDMDGDDMLGLDEEPDKAKAVLTWYQETRKKVKSFFDRVFSIKLQRLHAAKLRAHKKRKAQEAEDNKMNKILSSAMGWFKKISRKFSKPGQHQKGLLCQKKDRVRFGQTICLRRGGNWISRKGHWGDNSRLERSCIRMVIQPISQAYNGRQLRYGMPFMLRAEDERYFERRGRSLKIKKQHESYLFRPGFRKHFLRRHVRQYWTVLPARRVGRAVCIKDDFVLSVGGLGGTGRLAASVNNDDRRLLSLRTNKKPTVLSHKITAGTWFNFVRKPAIKSPCKMIPLGDECYEKQCPGRQHRIYCSGMDSAGETEKSVKKQQLKKKMLAKALAKKKNAKTLSYKDCRIAYYKCKKATKKVRSFRKRLRARAACRKARRKCAKMVRNAKKKNKKAKKAKKAKKTKKTKKGGLEAFREDSMY